MIPLLAILLAATPAELSKACSKGKGAACDELGNRWRLGLGMRRSDAHAADFFKKACAAKDKDGCADDALALGIGLAQRAAPETAIPRLDELCKEGVARACGSLGYLYYKRLGSKDDEARAEDLMSDACKKGDLEACSKVSTIAWQRGDYDRFDKYGRAACDNGDADGCASLADLHLVLKDLVRATFDYAQACKLGSTRGCTGQGLLLLNAGVDRKKAISLLSQSCKLGDGPACDAVREATQ